MLDSPSALSEVEKLHFPFPRIFSKNGWHRSGMDYINLKSGHSFLPDLIVVVLLDWPRNERFPPATIGKDIMSSFKRTYHLRKASLQALPRLWNK